MKCFEYSDYFGDLIPGIPVRRDGDQFYAEAIMSPILNRHGDPLHAKPASKLQRIRLSPDLEKRLRCNDDFASLTQTRITDCDLEIRAEPWLVPASSASNGQVLLLYTSVREKPGIKFSLNGKGAEILAQTAVQYMPGTPWPGFSILVKLPAGCGLEVRHCLKRQNDIMLADLRVTLNGNGTVATNFHAPRRQRGG